MLGEEDLTPTGQFEDIEFELELLSGLVGGKNSGFVGSQSVQNSSKAAILPACRYTAVR